MEKELPQMEAETRAEEREAHRKTLGWIDDAERILASGEAPEKLKDLAAKFLVPARRMAAIQRAAMKGEDLEKFGNFIPAFQDMLRYLDEIDAFSE